MESIPHKCCSQCGIDKPLTDFYRHSRRKDGHIEACIICHKAARRAKYVRKRVVVNTDTHKRCWKCHEWKSFDAYFKSRSRPDKLEPTCKACGKVKKYAYRARANELARQRPYDADARKAIKQRRRAHKANASGDHTVKQWQSLCKKYDNRCLCCGQRKKLEADHIVSLSIGGSNDISNIQPLCRSCNAEKHIKVIDYRPDAAQPQYIQERLF